MPEGTTHKASKIFGRLLVCRFERHNLRVTHAFVGVETLADNFSFAHQHGANHGIGACKSDALRRKFQSAMHEDGVSGGYVRHSGDVGLSFIAVGCELNLNQ